MLLPHSRVDRVDFAIDAGGAHRSEAVAPVEKREQPVLPRADVHEVVLDCPTAVGSGSGQGGFVDGGDQVDLLPTLRLYAGSTVVGGHVASATFLASAITLS